MTQQAPVPPVAPGPGTPTDPSPAGRALPAPAPTAPVVAGATTAQPPSKPVDTPALLARLGLVAVVTAVLFGVLAGVVQFLGWQSDGQAADETAQLVRVQRIESSLFRADALSTNGFLTAGLEPTARQTAYDRAIDDVLSTIAAAAKAQPADGRALAALSKQVEVYTTDVAQAAVYNRQGIVEGIAYQTAASAQLRSAALPIVKALVAANAQRSKDAMGGQHPVWLVLIGLVALVVLVLLNQRLARMFRRRINLGLAAAAAIVLVTTLVTAVVALLSARSNHSTEDGAYARAVAAATARTAADDAKANESLRLINRGSGQNYEDDWEAARKTVDATDVPDGRSSWDTYVKRHQQVVALDEHNEWRKAVVLATTDAPTGTSKPLDAFDTAMASDVTQAAQQATSDLSGGRALTLVLSILTALLGVVAAVAAARGIGARQREFL